jgi:hypothetical protein
VGAPQAPDPTALRELLDKQAIAEVVLRYCRGIDRMDRELVRSCYHADATDSHGSFEGGVDAFLDWVWRLLSRYESTMHFVGNLLVEPSGDVARAETYGIAYHRAASDDPKLELTTGFRYVDRFERRAGEWRIAKRIALTEWVRREDPSTRWPIAEHLRKGERGHGDALFEILRRS